MLALLVARCLCLECRPLGLMLVNATIFCHHIASVTNGLRYDRLTVDENHELAPLPTRLAALLTNRRTWR